jgi:bacterioferritin-associated ferredoxin
MYVCHCRAVTDGDVIAAISSPADSVQIVARRCGAGGRCGGCLPELARLLAQLVERESARRELLLRRALS